MSQQVRNQNRPLHVDHTNRHEDDSLPGNHPLNPHSFSDDISADPRLAPRTIVGLQAFIGNRAVQRLLTQHRKDQRIQRASFGSDGKLPDSQMSIVSQAASIAERVVTSHDFQKKWQNFWQTQASSITPKPTLKQYQDAVRGRVIHDMDTSKHAAVADLVKEEAVLPLERQTGAVTPVSSPNSYMRRFAIDQGIDSVVSLILHESIHGAGIPGGPGGSEGYEPFLHLFEAEAGFPLMMGGADIVSISQKRQGDYHVTVDIDYNIRQVDPEEPLPDDLEIQIVWQESGQLAYDEQPDGSRLPAKQTIPSRAGTGKWRWNARYPGLGTYAVRIATNEATLLGSKHFETNPRCVLGASGRHCDDE